MFSFFLWLLRQRDQRSSFDIAVASEQARLHGVYGALDGPYGDNATLYEFTKQLVEAAKFPNYNKFAAQAVLRLVDRCTEQRIPLPHDNVLLYMVGAAASLYAAEQLNDLPPNPALYSNKGDTAVLGEMRDLLLQHQRKVAVPRATLDSLIDAISTSFLAIARHLPPLAHEDAAGDVSQAAVTVSLIDLLPNVGHIIEQSLDAYNLPEAKQLGLFRWLHKHLATNAAVTERSRSARSILPSEHSGTSRQIVNIYLKNTPLEAIFIESHIPFKLPDETRFSGHWVIAPPGRGKTTLLHTMVMEDLNKDAAVILMDSKGDFIEPFRNLKQIEDRLIIVDPNPDRPIAINPLDIPKSDISLAVSNLEYVFSSLLETKMTPLQTVLFRSILRALILGFPNPTLETFRDILANGVKKYAAYIKLLPQDLQDFFANEFNTKVYEDRRKEIIWRIRLLLENDTMRAMMLALRTRFNIIDAMDSGKVVIVNNSKARLGDQGAEFFGRFFIAQILAAAQQRAGRSAMQKKPV
jgi:hypothetical protein